MIVMLLLLIAGAVGFAYWRVSAAEAKKRSTEKVFKQACTQASKFSASIAAELDACK